MKKSPPTVRPGQKVPDSGIYQAGKQKATMVQGEPAPPTSTPGKTWKQIHDTNPKK
jgi:hypothetical protein